MSKNNELEESIGNLKITNSIPEEESEEKYESDFNDISDEDVYHDYEPKKGNNKNVKSSTLKFDRASVIERENGMLLKKVLAHNRRPKQNVQNAPMTKKNSAAINRQKQQQKIDHDNLALLRKIQTIKPFGLSKPPAMY